MVMENASCIYYFALGSFYKILSKVINVLNYLYQESIYHLHLYSLTRINRCFKIISWVCASGTKRSTIIRFWCMKCSITTHASSSYHVIFSASDIRREPLLIILIWQAFEIFQLMKTRLILILHFIRPHAITYTKFRNFTLSFGRLRQRIVLKCVSHVLYDYFSSFNQSDHCFLALPLPWSNFKKLLEDVI